MLAIDHVQIAAPPGSEAQARRFFVGLLGLTELPKQGATAASGGIWLNTGSIQLHVGVTSSFVPATKAHVALSTSSSEQLHTLALTLQESGHPVQWDTRLPGVERFFTTDPWGNRLELMSAQAGPSL